MSERKTISIDANTFKKGVDTGDTIVPRIITGDVTLDQVHDEIFISNKKKPSTWEDQILESTTLGHSEEDGDKILENISTIGKCVKLHNHQIIGQSSVPTEGQIPYSIPNNNTDCYIRDCFSGTGIPGLNNIFDQANMSLMAFIDYHNKDNAIFTNPLLGSNPGGMGQQYYAKGHDHLKYTAYFNYDLLMFKYITLIWLAPTDPTLRGLVKTVIKTIDNTQPDALTPDEIETINVININYLWCKLMIYCYESIADDYFLKKIKNEYTQAMQALTQIRFESFAKNKDNFFSNPTFGYRGNGSITNQMLLYIDRLCNHTYVTQPFGSQNDNTALTGNVTQPFGSQNDNTALTGNVQYVTTQAMVARSMIQNIPRGKRTGIVARTGNNKDPIKNACMNEIDKLFKSKIINGNNSEQIARGWSMVKFSGDSSHIVLGEFMETIKAKYQLKFNIVFLVSERPLTGRLLSQRKDIFVQGTKLIMNNFVGPGSDDKYDRHAALYIQFDPTKQYNNILYGLYQKLIIYKNNYNKYSITKTKFPITDGDSFISAIISAAANVDLPSLHKELVKLFSTITPPPQSLTPQSLTPQSLNQAYLNDLSNSISTLDFVKLLEFDGINNKIKKLFLDINKPYFAMFGNILIGSGHVRLSRATNWKSLMLVLESKTQSSGIENGYYGMKEILSLIFALYKTTDKLTIVDNEDDLVKAAKESANDHMLTLISNPDLLKILNKIISSFDSVRGLADMFSRNKEDKYNSFIQDRISEWMSNKTGDSTPSKIELIVNGLREFIDLCLGVRSNFKDQPNINEISNAKLLGGGIRMVGGEIEEYIQNYKKYITANQINTINVSDILTENILVHNYKDIYDTYLNKINEQSESESIGQDPNIFHEILTSAIEILNYIQNSPLIEVSDNNFIEIMNIYTSDETEIIAYEHIRQIVLANIYPVFVDILARESANSDNIKDGVKESLQYMNDIYKTIILYDVNSNDVNSNDIIILTDLFKEFGVQFRENIIINESILKQIPQIYDYIFNIPMLISNETPSLLLLHNAYNRYKWLGAEYELTAEWYENVKTNILYYLSLVLGNTQNMDIIDILTFATGLRQYNNLIHSRERISGTMQLRDAQFTIDINILFGQNKNTYKIKSKSNTFKSKSNRKDRINKNNPYGGKLTRRKRYIRSIKNKRITRRARTNKQKKSKKNLTKTR